MSSFFYSTFLISLPFLVIRFSPHPVALFAHCFLCRRNLCCKFGSLNVPEDEELACIRSPPLFSFPSEPLFPPSLTSFYFSFESGSFCLSGNFPPPLSLVVEVFVSAESTALSPPSAPSSQLPFRKKSTEDICHIGLLLLPLLVPFCSFSRTVLPSPNG